MSEEHACGGGQYPGRVDAARTESPADVYRRIPLEVRSVCRSIRQQNKNSAKPALTQTLVLVLAAIAWTIQRMSEYADCAVAVWLM